MAYSTITLGSGTFQLTFTFDSKVLSTPIYIVWWITSNFFCTLYKLLRSPDGNTVYHAVCYFSGFILLRAIIILNWTTLSLIPGPLVSKLFYKSLIYYKIKGTLHQHILRQHQKYGQVVRLGPEQVYITNPSDWKHILSSSYEYPKRIPPDNSVFGPPLNTLAIHDSKEHGIRRILVDPAYTTTYIKAMEKIILDTGPMRLKSKIDEEICFSKEQSRPAKINHANVFNYMSLDVFGKLGFDEDFGMLDTCNDTILEGIKAVEFIYMLENYSPFLAKYKKRLFPWIVKKYDTFLLFIKNIVDERMKGLKWNNNKPFRRDILQVFIDAVDPETNRFMNKGQIISESLLHLVKGPKSTSSTLSWTLFLLMVYPITYRKVCYEIRSAFPDKSKPITYTEGLSKLSYLEAILLESMRFIPASVTSISRKITKPGLKLVSGHILPSGTKVKMSIYSIHHDKKLWKYPHVFSPERFMVNEYSSKQDVDQRKQNLLTFSMGPRACPGHNLAWCEMFMTLANLLRDYDFWLPEDMPYGPDVIDEETGQPKIIPGFLAEFTGYSLKNPQSEGWICVKHNTSI
ncbi:hypothetical protein H4219_003642 [Mycoemilia scoparia]|uniref:Cytochrome P450 n=1 Tax=Mycoemilia scoparia TaxID=417184 RepID=A0A9W8A265_9FUNG|nr:hypothetical protein H4219_003642 [Mycoemilia scoparia]